MNAYRTTLIVIHVLGAIAGIGPTFAFGLLGRMASQGGQQAAFALKAMKDIEWKVVFPVAVFTQPITGALLIFETGRDANFFKHEWLVISIVLYVIVVGLSYGPEHARQKRLIAAAESGAVGTPEFLNDAKIAKAMGPVFGIMTVAIIVLMVWKPLDSA